MDAARRRELARRALDGYPSGPAAPVRATADALAKARGAAAVVLVEGISDQIAVETAAACQGRDLAADRVVVVPVGGAHATGRFLTMFGDVPLTGLCDRREAGLMRRALAAAGRAEVEIFVCVDDLEDELIRAVGAGPVEALLDAQGDLGSFRSLQAQPAWRERETGQQLRRFLGSGSRRKSRYARLLVEAAADRGALPRPLGALLAGQPPAGPSQDQRGTVSPAGTSSAESG